MAFDYIRRNSVEIVGRGWNAISLQPNKSIIITTDLLKTSLEYSDSGLISGKEEECKIELDAIEQNVKIISNEILLMSRHKSNSKSPDETIPLVYGTRLIEVLNWIIKVLKNHSHPPNGKPIPDFYPKADYYISNMSEYLLNDNVRMK